MIGLSYIFEKRWKEAIEILTKASENDPVGGIQLAAVLCNGELPIELRNFQKALLLLERYASVRDKDFPTMQPLAKYMLGTLYFVGTVIPADKEKARKYIEEASDLAAKESEFTIMALSNIAYIASLIGEHSDPEHDLKLLNNIERIIQLIQTKEIQNKFYWNINKARALLHCSLKQYEEALNTAMKLKEYDPASGNAIIAKIYKETQRYELALQHYKIAADMGEPESCYVVCCYYYPFENLNEANLDDFGKFLHLSHTNKNKEKAIHYMKKSAENGNLDAMFNLALMYSDPKYGMVDYSEMVKWALLRNDNGRSYNDLQANQALILIAIYTIDKKHYEIVDILKQYAINGASANLMLSEIYRADEFPQKDSLISFEYIKKAAELG
ncbi:MAG: hypothetical protein Q4E63_07090, partial [Prevotellaceae bacterium]|nr:hypothetical protein [Prevotellaceae bacterium]